MGRFPDGRTHLTDRPIIIGEGVHFPERRLLIVPYTESVLPGRSV